MEKIIAHLDMDAFFAAIEEKDRPRLKGMPIVVGSDPEDGKGRGVVSTANYKAREYGIRSAMPIRQAWELSEAAKKKGQPTVVFIGVNGRRYSEVSKRIMEIVKKYSKITEEASVDEIYIDLTFAGSFKNATAIAKKIKQEIFKKESLTCSLGLGPNKLIAKIASDHNKPDGLTIVQNEEVQQFLDPLPVRKIPGIGPKTEKVLQGMKIRTVQELRGLEETLLERKLGKWGRDLFRKARGESEGLVENRTEVKSIGEQETFRKDTLEPGVIFQKLKNLSIQVFERFKKSGFNEFRVVVLTVRFNNFETKNRSRTLPEALNSSLELEFEIMKMIQPFFDQRENPQRKPIRLVGVRVEKLK